MPWECRKLHLWRRSHPARWRRSHERQSGQLWYGRLSGTPAVLRQRWRWRRRHIAAAWSVAQHRELSQLLHEAKVFCPALEAGIHANLNSLRGFEQLCRQRWWRFWKIIPSARHLSVLDGCRRKRLEVLKTRNLALGRRLRRWRRELLLGWSRSVAPPWFTYCDAANDFGEQVFEVTLCVLESTLGCSAWSHCFRPLGQTAVGDGRRW